MIIYEYMLVSYLPSLLDILFIFTSERNMLHPRRGVPEKAFGYSKCSNTLLANGRKQYNCLRCLSHLEGLAFDTQTSLKLSNNMPHWPVECINMDQYHQSLGSKVLLFDLGAKYCAKIARLPTSTSFVNRPPELPKGKQDPKEKSCIELHSKKKRVATLIILSHGQAPK